MAKRRRKKLLLPAADALKRRLVRVIEVAALTVADLAVWFDRDHATVYAWIYYDKEPRKGPRKDDAMHRLKMLEDALAYRVEGFPIPVSMSQRDRADHVREMYRNVAAAALKRTARWSKRIALRSGDPAG